jgi:hypothetical protein
MSTTNWENPASESTHGHWLSAPGRYRKRIQSMCSCDPRLESGDVSIGFPSTSHRADTARIVHLGVDHKGAISQRSEYDPANGLREFFQNTGVSTSETVQGNIYLVEAINPTVIAVLGDHFSIHPSFFADHYQLRIAIDEKNPITSVTDNYTLPSARSGNSGNFRLRYYEPLDFGEELPSGPAACAATGRLIEISRSINGSSSIGMARRKCSMWQKIGDDKHWKCMYKLVLKPACLSLTYKVLFFATHKSKTSGLIGMRVLNGSK